MDIRKLRDERAKALADARAILDAAEQENRDLNQDEQNRYDAFNTDIDSLTARIDRAERQAQRETELRMSANGNENPMREHQPGAQSANRSRTETAEYRQGVLRYLISGIAGSDVITDRHDDEARSILGVSLTGSGATGGILAPATLERALLDFGKQVNVMRSLASVRSSTSDVDIPYASTGTTAYHIAEGADFTASTPAFAKINMKAYKVGALSVVTHEAMQDMFLNLESWIQDEFGTAFANLEETDFINGTGSSQPRGVLLDAAAGVTAAATAAITSDEIMDLQHKLKQKYRKGSTWLMHDSTVKLLRKLKTTDNQYIWQPGMQAGAPDTLLGAPVVTSVEMPEVAAGKKAIAYGDFSWYRILDRQGLYLQRLNELYATSGQVGFMAYRRYDARLLTSEAVQLLTMKAGT